MWICQAYTPQFVLGYLLESQNQSKRNLVQRVAKSLQLPMVMLDEYLAKSRQQGPFSMLGLLQAAKTIVTDSFHGLALSIVYQKPFWVVGLSGQADLRSERAVRPSPDDCLANRFVPADRAEQCTAGWEVAIDWSDVSQRMDRRIALSKQFLEQALANPA